MTSIPEGFEVVSNDIPEGFEPVDSSYPGAGIIEPALAVASSAGLSALGGLVGGAIAATPGQPEGSGAEVVKSFQGQAFEPRTEEGKENLAKVAEYAKLLNVPAAGLAGIAEAIQGGSLDDVVKTIARVREQGIGKEAGESVIEAGGGPGLATFADLISQSASDTLTGVTAIKGAKTGLTGAKNALTSTAKVAGKEMAPLLKSGSELAKDIKRFQTPKTRDIARQLKDGVIDRDLANFKLADMGIENPTIRQQLLGADLPKVIKNKSLMNASKQGFDEGFLNSTSKLATNTDKKLMLKMTNIGEKGRKNPFFGDEFRPADVAGEVYLDKVNAVKAINRAAGKEIGQAAKKLKGKEFPVADIGDNFLEALDGLKVKIIDGKLNFDDALVSGAGRKKAIQDIFGRMVRNKNPDALDLHELKQFIDETVSYGKSIRGLGGKSEGVLRELRLSIKNRLEENFPDYAKANKAYSDSINILDEIQSLAGKKTDLTSDSASGTLASLARRLTSEAQSRGRVAESLKNLDAVLKEHSGRGVKLLDGKGDGAANLRVLMKYANELDRVTGNAAATSFTGASETAIKAATGPKQFIADKAVEAAKGLAGVSQENAYKAMREFLQSELKNPQK